MSVLVIEHSELTGAERLGRHLMDLGVPMEIVRVHRDEALPSDLDDTDAILSCGGPQSPFADEPWLERELDLLREADARQLPLLGLCLGSQLLARALGGEVVELPGGPEIGWFDVHLTASGREDVLLAGQPWSWMQLHWHAWQVETVPPGARVLGSSDGCEVQMWARGMRTYAIQFHPECDITTPVAWAGDDADMLRTAGMTVEMIQQQTDAHFDTYQRLTSRLYDAVASLLFPSKHRQPA